MSIELSYPTQNTCSRMIRLQIDGEGVLRDVRFEGGCQGNLRGLSLLSVGRPAAEVSELLSGIVCPSSKVSSCPHQLSRAITAALELQREKSMTKENREGV